MPVRVAMSEAEYMETPFPGPEPDFVDGEVIERGLPTTDHSAVQFFFSGRLWPLQEQGRLFTRPELRMPVAAGRYRVADLAIFDKRPLGLIPHTPPLAVIEILSPDDRATELHRKLADYAAFGVRHIWIVDPMLREIYVYADRSLRQVDSFDLPAYGLRFTEADIMAQIVD